MAGIHVDNDPNGLCYNFEAAVAYLLPYDPVAKKHQAMGKCGAALILNADASQETNVSSATTTQSKAGIGKTGVHFHYYKHSEYQKLTDEQKKELSEW